MSVAIDCAECGEAFRPQRYKNGRQRFCSGRCGARYRYRRNHKKRAAQAKAWREANRERQREYFRRHHLKRKYGLTPEDYERMLAGQDGRCAVCRTPAERAATRGGALCVDHDHVTGQVRGLLCDYCNAILGFAGDSPTTLRSAIHYLEETTYASAVD